MDKKRSKGKSRCNFSIVIMIKVKNEKVKMELILNKNLKSEFLPIVERERERERERESLLLGYLNCSGELARYSNRRGELASPSLNLIKFYNKNNKVTISWEMVAFLFYKKEL